MSRSTSTAIEDILLPGEELERKIVIPIVKKYWNDVSFHFNIPPPQEITDNHGQKLWEISLPDNWEIIPIIESNSYSVSSISYNNMSIGQAFYSIEGSSYTLFHEDLLFQLGIIDDDMS